MTRDSGHPARTPQSRPGAITPSHTVSDALHQIWNHRDGALNQTDMHFTAQAAYGLAYHLIMSAAGH